MNLLSNQRWWRITFPLLWDLLATGMCFECIRNRNRTEKFNNKVKSIFFIENRHNFVSSLIFRLWRRSRKPERHIFAHKTLPYMFDGLFGRLVKYMVISYLTPNVKHVHIFLLIRVLFNIKTYRYDKSPLINIDIYPSCRKFLHYGLHFKGSDKCT